MKCALTDNHDREVSPTLGDNLVPLNTPARRRVPFSLRITHTLALDNPTRRLLTWLGRLAMPIPSSLKGTVAIASDVGAYEAKRKGERGAEREGEGAAGRDDGDGTNSSRRCEAPSFGLVWPPWRQCVRTYIRRLRLVFAAVYLESRSLRCTMHLTLGGYLSPPETAFLCL